MKYYLYSVKKEDDFEAYWQLKSDPLAVAWSGFSTEPDYQKLRNHFLQVIQNNQVYLFYFIDRVNKNILGYCQINYLDNINCEISGFSVLSKYQGRGMGKEILHLAKIEMKTLGFKKIIGYVSENNISSIRSFEYNGWTKTNNYEHRSLEALSRVDKFFLYEAVL